MEGFLVIAACLTWPEMVELEPGLAAIEQAAHAAAGPESLERGLVYRDLKQLLDPLVGSGARRRELADPKSWETACRLIADALAGETAS